MVGNDLLAPVLALLHLPLRLKKEPWPLISDSPLQPLILSTVQSLSEVQCRFVFAKNTDTFSRFVFSAPVAFPSLALSLTQEVRKIMCTSGSFQKNWSL